MGTGVWREPRLPPPRSHPVIKSASLADDFCSEITVNGGRSEGFLHAVCSVPVPWKNAGEKEVSPSGSFIQQGSAGGRGL